MPSIQASSQPPPNSHPSAQPGASQNQVHSRLPDGQQRLRARGIFAAAQAAGWQLWQLRKHKAQPLGWRYPIYDPATGAVYRNARAQPIWRWKNFDKENQGGEKYCWPFGQQGCPPWYILPGTSDAIATANGIIYLAAGEVDVLTYQSAGLKNTLAWLNGESSVPEDTAERLLALNVREVRYFVDRDATGENSAQILAVRLRGTPIELAAYRLPEYLGPKGDINDLWRWKKFDRASFIENLEGIRREETGLWLRQAANLPPKVKPPPASEQGQRSKRRGVGTTQKQAVDWNVERSRWIREEVMPALNRIAPVARTENKIERHHCPNPQHSDQTPSFRISYDRDTEVGIPQCSCHIQDQPHPWDRVAEWVGARPLKVWFKEERAPFYSRRKTRPRQPANTSPETAKTEVEAPAPIDEVEKKLSQFLPDEGTWPYTVEHNRMIHLKLDMKSGLIERVLIADFYAQIAETLTTAGGVTTYRLKGETHDGKPFSVEIEAEAFSDARQLKAKLEKAAGPRCSVAVRMSEYLGPAIKRLTLHPPEIHKFDRTGWHHGKFLLPGYTAPDIEFSLWRKLPYGVTTAADLDEGVQALRALIEAIPVQASLPALMIAFQAPLAQPMGWRSERYALGIVGRTGSFKTTWTQVAMTLYGPDFIHDEYLIKWGEGATRNAIMQLATQPSDLPFLIDNYKPNTGAGGADFRNLIHNILEGGEKDRLDRNSELKESRPVFSWPIITAEDVPDDDPATLARLLIVQFDWQRGEDNPRLRQAQEQSQHLNAVGKLWLTWLESQASEAVISEAKQLYTKFRQHYANLLRERSAKMANILRVATNLASNATTHWVLTQHPVIGSLFAEYQAGHEAGLVRIVQQMALGTTDSLPAQIFLAALQELLASGRCALQNRDEKTLPNAVNMVGYQDNEGVYLLADLALEAVLRVKGPSGLGYASKTAIYSQLKELGLIASVSSGGSTRVIKEQNQSVRVLHLKPEALEPSEGEAD
jgi:Domain of unknown function (DUF927)